ncbi:MAG: cell wall-binding repeat-containing protein [Candidatus Nanohaloarchaea archaeon]
MKKKILLIALLLTIAGAASAQSTNPDNVNTVILASTANYPDAFIASPAGNKIGAPVLLTDKDQLSQSTSDALDRLQPDNVIIVGGPAVISDNVESQVDAKVNSTTRLWGMTQLGTSIQVSQHFWATGSDKAVVVQYPQNSSNGYQLLSAVKNEVQDSDLPILISKEGTLSASVISEIKRLNATEVDVYATNSVNSSQDLKDVGVNEVNVETGDMTELADRIQKGVIERDRNRTRLVIVAAANFEHAISAPNVADSASFVVGNDAQIQNAIDLVRNSSATEIKITGKPDLAQRIAEQIRNQTDRNVSVVSGRPEEVSARFPVEHRHRWKEIQSKRLKEWKDHMEHSPNMQQAANHTLTQARAAVNANSTQRAREALREAEKAYQDGDYFEARTKAQIAISQHNAERFRTMDQSEIQKEVEQETEDVNKAVERLKDTNKKFSKDVRDAEDLKSRLEVIQKYREERRKAVDDLRDRMKNRSEEKNKTQEDGNTLRTGSATGSLTVNGKEVTTDITFTAPTTGYSVNTNTNVDNDKLVFRYEISSPDSMAGQAITKVRANATKTLKDGNYTVKTVVTVDGEDRFSSENKITVPSDQSNSLFNDSEDSGSLDTANGGPGMEKED